MIDFQDLTVEACAFAGRAYHALGDEQATLYVAFLALWLVLIAERRVRKVEGMYHDLLKGSQDLPVEPVASDPGKESRIGGSGESEVASRVSARDRASAIVSKDAGSPPSRAFWLGMGKTRRTFGQKVIGLLGSSRQLVGEDLEDLEELLILGDVGVATSTKLVKALGRRVSGDEGSRGLKPLEVLKNLLLEILEEGKPGNGDTGWPECSDKLQVVFVVGVNGVGKTTTIGKLANLLTHSGKKVLLGACDTFRAAAGEQLEVWATRAGVDLERGDNEKPSTVLYRALHRARKGNYDVLLVDTAGRLHTRVNLMQELSALVALAAREVPGAPHDILLVLDGASGQNALQQARDFHSKINLSGLVITKLDGTPKGGIVVGIKDELKVGIRFVGLGEGVDDLREFNAGEFVDGLLGIDGDQESDCELKKVASIRS